MTFSPNSEHGFAAYESTQPVPHLVASAHGVVLDLGPGTGIQLSRFDPTKIEHVYGVEPNVAFREGFLKKLRADKLGVDGKYTLINCGLEDTDVLEGFGVREGSLDCVVSMQVMVRTRLFLRFFLPLVSFLRWFAPIQVCCSCGGKASK